MTLLTCNFICNSGQVTFDISINAYPAESSLTCHGFNIFPDISLLTCHSQHFKLHILLLTYHSLCIDLEKLQAVQMALADILSKITLFWGHFEPNILYFWARMEEEELTMDNWGWIKGILGRRMVNWGFSIENWGCRALNWG